MHKSDFRFFIIIPPGLEELATQELHFWTQDYHDLKTHLGGIEITCPLELGLALNYVLKIPSRILLRLDEFKCKDFGKLESKLRRLNWSDYIGLGNIDFQVSSVSSRVFHKKNIKETATQSYLKYRKGQPAGLKESTHDQMFYIKFVDNVCTVSVDTTGKHLHLRGYKTYSTEAPLRENLAAGLLWHLITTTQINPHTFNLIDPFCGSGTFLGEAFYLDQPLKGLRSFSFEGFKAVHKGHIKISPPTVNPVHGFKSYYGFDIHKKAIEASRENLKKLPSIQLSLQDVYTKNILNASPNIVICNPPYGERLEGIDIKKAISQILENYNPEYLALLLPKKLNLAKNKNLNLISTLALRNTKIPVHFYIFKKN